MVILAPSEMVQLFLSTFKLSLLELDFLLVGHVAQVALVGRLGTTKINLVYFQNGAPQPLLGNLWSR